MKKSATSTVKIEQSKEDGGVWQAKVCVQDCTFHGTIRVDLPEKVPPEQGLERGEE